MIELRDIARSYYEGDTVHVVLHDLSLRVNEGEFVALLGPSGSGKSTLLNLVAGIDLPTAGEVVVGGTVLTSLSERERTLFRRRHIGFVFQFFNLLPTLTVEENLLLPLELNGRPAHPTAARELLERVGLASRAATFPDRLSGGEQQRIAIARALIHEPRLVLADEPTGNLDADTGAHVLDLLERLVREEHRTLFVATHSDRIVERADRVLAVRNGRVVEAPR
jgi:putative ABC transport system ATP-binding protein